MNELCIFEEKETFETEFEIFDDKIELLFATEDTSYYVSDCVKIPECREDFMQIEKDEKHGFCVWHNNDFGLEVGKKDLNGAVDYIKENFNGSSIELECALEFIEGLKSE